MEAFGLLACHVDTIPDQLVDRICSIFNWHESWSIQFARIFLYGLTDEIRLLGAVDIKESSNYFRETGGYDTRQPGILGNKGQPKIF